MNAKLLLQNTSRFILLVLAQVFLFRNMNFYNLATPFPYILFIMLLPFNTPNALQYTLAFTIGLTLDVFYDTLGVHATACTVLCLVRIVFINLTIDRNNLDEPTPTLSGMGFSWFSIYLALCTVTHHLTLFFLEAFRLSGFGYTLLRALLSGLFTFVLVMLLELVFYKRQAN